MASNAECIFCRIAAGEIPSTRVYEDERVVAFRDINPQAPTHVLVIPRRHLESLADVNAGDGDLCAALLRAAVEVARREGIEASGYRVLTNTGADAGQTVGHLHFHVLGGRQLGPLG